MAFFDAQSDLWDSDEECIGFTQYYLKDLCSLYKDSEHKNKNISLVNIKFDAIIQDAKEFMKPIQSCNKTTDATEIIDINDDDDEWAHLVDNSDESDD